MLAAKISREFKNSAKHPLQQSIRLGRLGIHIALSDYNINVKILAQGIVWQSLVYRYFEINIEQDKIPSQSLVNHARN